jgi:glucose/arabinose dehydrogenase
MEASGRTGDNEVNGGAILCFLCLLVDTVRSRAFPFRASFGNHHDVSGYVKRVDIVLTDVGLKRMLPRTTLARRREVGGNRVLLLLRALSLLLFKGFPPGPNLPPSVIRRSSRALGWLALVAAVLFTWSLTPTAAGEERPYGLEHRELWTTSRLVGSPDPPPPYTVEKTYTQIQWRLPLYIAAEPGTDSLLIVLQGGERDRPSQVLRVRDDPEASETEVLLEMEGRLIYAVAFHPTYVESGHLYVFSNGPTGEAERFNRVSRFTVERTPPFRCDSQSENTILEWSSAGHDGGDLVFGNDGMLYIASGDGTSDSDTLVSGQDVTNLLGAILRIDVDRPDEGDAYSVPPDNPLIGVPDARPEIWAYGLRNPWRMCVDRPTGQIWVGNNGQDLWETAHLIRRGENYGWSVYEGSHPFYLHRPRGPTPIVPPTIEHHHSEFLSLTGGVVYRGQRHADLDGVYIYGDHTTGRIWGARHDGTRLAWHGELANTTLQITAFGVNHNGELLVADYGGGIYRLVPAEHDANAPPFRRGSVRRASSARSKTSKCSLA